jgi:peptidoglycan LD-endopeptidase CwlK
MIDSPNRSLNLLYPPFLAKVQKGLILAEKVGLHAEIFEGWRSVQRQGDLFAQGRTAPGKIVTWVRPWQSLHQYGVAVDIVFDGDIKPGVQWSWEGDYADGQKDDYAQLAVVMKGVGLEWLGDKNIERAHFQLSYGMSAQQMARITEDRGLLGLWAEFDKTALVRPPGPSV